MKRLALIAGLAGLAYAAWYAYDYWQASHAPTSAWTSVADVTYDPDSGLYWNS